MPNMIIPNNGTMYGAIQVNPDGMKKDKNAKSKTHTANVFPTKLLSLSKDFKSSHSSQIIWTIISLLSDNSNTQKYRDDLRPVKKSI
jgi:N-acetylmuramoyl-L-alanine amidase CwlA